MTDTKSRTGSLSVERRRIVERDGARRDFEIRLVDGESLEDVQRPEFLGHKSDLLMPGDRITVLGPELSPWCEMLVIECDEALSEIRSGKQATRPGETR